MKWTKTQQQLHTRITKMNRRRRKKLDETEVKVKQNASESDFEANIDRGCVRNKQKSKEEKTVCQCSYGDFYFGRKDSRNICD